MLVEVKFLAHICFFLQAQFLVIACIQSLKPSEKKKKKRLNIWSFFTCHLLCKFLIILFWILLDDSAYKIQL